MQIAFICVANSARSQMAEGLARSMAPTGVEVFSAGSEPSRIRPEAVAVLAERGIDISAHQAKHFDAIPLETIDTIITLCAEERCPIVRADALRLHWPLPNPAPPREAEGSLDVFREVRDELERRLQALFEEAME